jgi:abortive infection alpha-like protein
MMPQEDEVNETLRVIQPIVKDVYQDAVQPAAKEVGVVLQTVVKTVNAALLPLRTLIWGFERIETWLIPTLAEKLKDVPKERIITPNPTVSGPTLEALRFAGHEPSLRELYANLLATSMDSDSAPEAHPAFVEILRQLTPDEARIVGQFPLNRPFPLITIQAMKKDETGFVDVLTHFSLLGYESGCTHPDMTPSYLVNLCRLGLAEIPPSFYYIAPGIYEPLEKHPQVLERVSAIEKLNDRKPKIVKEGLKITTLGEQFCAACVIQRDRK